MKMENENFDEYWKNLTEEQREEIKELVIERIKTMPSHLRLSVG
jgi:cephalosporin-C deacetylase-like acetyl esterase